MSLGGLLGGRIKKEAAKPAPPKALDELEQYLADTEEPTIDVKVLLWRKEKEAKWPNLAKMVRQYFACLLGRRRARVLYRRQDARRPLQVGQELDA